MLVNRVAQIIRYGRAYHAETMPDELSDEDWQLLLRCARGEVPVDDHIAELCAVDACPAWRILAITFTNKAAGELKERLTKMLGEDGGEVMASTFHSFCARILRREGEQLGYTSHFTIYDTDDSRRLMKECMKALNIEEKVLGHKAILNELGRAKDSLLSPAEFEAQAGSDFRKKKIAACYKMYQDRLAQADAMDFDDLLYQTVRLFQQFPEILQRYQKRYRYIMVDEYQDTNHAQYQLISLLAAGHGNLCVVGDDDQSIYKFRGANIYNILNFEEEYPDAKVVKLEQNYRSKANILNSANAVIANNEGRKDKRLWTEQEDGEKVTFTRYGTEYEEANGVASRIKTLKNQGVSLDDIAILYRTNAQSRVLEEKLLYENLPYKIYGGQNFYGRKEIMDLVSYLKVLANPIDDQAIKRIINVPKRGIGATTVDKLDMYAQSNGYNLYDALLDIEEVPGMTRNVEKIRKFTDMMEGFKARLVEGEFISEVFDAIMDESGYREALEAEATDEARTRLDNLEELKNKIVTYEESAEVPTLTGLLEDIALVADTEEEDEDGVPTAKVTLMTLHSAKGLEFPYVFMTGMEERLFPSGM